MEKSPKGKKMSIQIIVPCAIITSKSAAWGSKERELFKASQEAIRYAVQNSPHRTQLAQWLESRTKLAMTIEFHLSNQRVHNSDLDSLLADLLNPLVEGACGPRPEGKPTPQTKDALFWQINVAKVVDSEEKVIINIEPLQG